MGEDTFIADLAKSNMPSPESNVFRSISSEYEKVVLHSLITSFGLDFLVHDQRGGDVDTIRNVRDTSVGIEERYKSSAHRAAYQSREPYDTKAYHTDPRYVEIVRGARKSFNETGGMQKDAYVPGNTVVYNKASSLGAERHANLDHVIAAHEIHEDPGRILAGLDGKDLANSPGNLRFTNERLNKSKSDMSVDKFLDTRGADLPEETREQMRSVDDAARDDYEQRLVEAYYYSPDFLSSAASAAAARGFEMGIRQALGFVFVELWFSCKTEMLSVTDNSEIQAYFSAIIRGIENGFENIRLKHHGLLESFGSGLLAGALASLTTTLCNIFLNTEERTIRNIRFAYAAVVQAGNVLLFNPNDLLLGDRLRTATVILATGANVLIGATVGDMIAKTPLGVHPIVGTQIRAFSSTLVSGLLSCTLLLLLDRSKYVNKIVNQLNQYLTEDQTFKQIASEFETLAAKVAELNIAEFREETDKYLLVAARIRQVESDEELDSVLSATFSLYKIHTPWQGDFDSFMGDPSSRLVFD